MSNKNSSRANAAMCGGGATVSSRPSCETGQRYEHLLQTEWIELRATRSQFVVVARFPRKDGIIAAARHLISACANLALLMFSLNYNHHNEL